VARTLIPLAEMYQQTGRASEAEPLLNRALEVLAKAAPSQTIAPELRTHEVSALLLLGRTAEARPLADRIFATGYRRRTFLTLCLAHGIRP